MALGRQVVDLVGHHLLDDTQHAGGIRQVTVVQEEVPVGIVPLAVKVIDAVCIEQGGAALDAVHVVSLFEQQLSQIGTVLPGNTSDQSNLARHCRSPALRW